MPPFYLENGMSLVYFVDVDETICEHDAGKNTKRDYSLVRPIFENIEKINKLHEQGHIIVYYTARGSGSKTANWFQLTLQQLHSWGARFHELRMGKPLYDYIIDDRALRIEEI